MVNDEKVSMDDYTVEIQVGNSVTERFTQSVPSYKNLKLDEGSNKILIESFV
jgi:hypothetical protein